MKWASKSVFATYSYSIDLERLISPFYHLVLDLIKVKTNGRDFHEWCGEVFNIKEVTELDQLGNNDTEESFLIDLARYLEDYLYSKSNQLGNTVFLLFRDKGIVIAPAKQKLNPTLIDWIEKSGVINKFFSLISDEGINQSKNSLSKLMNDQYFGTSVKANETGLLKGTIIQKNYVDQYIERPIDSQSIWMCENWRNKFEIREDTEFSEISFPDVDGLCLAFGDKMLPLENVDQFIKEEACQDYFWLMLNDVFALRKKRASIYRDKCTEFIEALKNSNFAQLLKGLQYNLYLTKDAQEIPDNYKVFFEEVYNIEEFKDNTEQILFTGCHLQEQIESRQTMLGLYKTEKDDTEYNLHAWINVESSNKQKLTSGGGVTDTSIKTVYALKPYLSYYFCSDYFEDLFNSLLIECGGKSLPNFELFTSDNPNNCLLEIDNLVRKPNGTLIYIENKTTLNRYNIEETIDEIVCFQRIMNESYPHVKVEYMMISPYYNETVEQGFRYFINAEGCSLNDFYIPIAQFNDVQLHCIVEPEYNKLKTIVQELVR